GMALHAAVARRRRGQLLGGSDGRALVESADAWMQTKGIRNPARTAALLAPPSLVEPAQLLTSEERESGERRLANSRGEKRAAAMAMACDVETPATTNLRTASPRYSSTAKRSSE